MIIRKDGLSEQVAAKVKELILSERLAPGDRLPTEHDLALRFGVSRVSVREATKALAFMGIIRSAPKRGLTVSELDLGRTSEYLGFHFAISNYPPEKLIRARMIIELGALPYAMEALAGDAKLAGELMAHVDQMAQVYGDLERYLSADIAFHRALVMSSGVEPLVAFTDILHAFFKRFRENAKEVDRRLGNEVHRQLIVNLRKGNLAKAQQMLRNHIEPGEEDLRAAKKKERGHR